jgi:hypothetical protein
MTESPPLTRPPKGQKAKKLHPKLGPARSAKLYILTVVPCRNEAYSPGHQDESSLVPLVVVNDYWDVTELGI